MSLLSLLFPERCLLCHEFLPKGHTPTCESCARWLEAQLSQKIRRTCAFVDGQVNCALPYDRHSQGAVARFKFYHRPHYAGAFARWMLETLDSDILERVQCITWVPSGRSKYRQRGYIPCQLLAQQLSHLTGKPALELLIKRSFVRQQSKLPREQRRGNVADAFVASQTLSSHAGETVLLVDDVITTGATLSECAKTLKIHGSGLVYAATFVSAGGKND